MPITEDQLKKLTNCHDCGEDRIFSPADVTVRAGNDDPRHGDPGFEDVPLCDACGDSNQWVRAPKRAIAKSDVRKTWDGLKRLEREALMVGYLEGFRAGDAW